VVNIESIEQDLIMKNSEFLMQLSNGLYGLKGLDGDWIINLDVHFKLWECAKELMEYEDERERKAQDQAEEEPASKENDGGKADVSSKTRGKQKKEKTDEDVYTGDSQK
jgi:hypothetical protein